MKKCLGLLALTVLFCTIEAVHIEFEDGSWLDVPNSIIIHNDLEKDFEVYEYWIDNNNESGYVFYKLPKSQKLQLDDMNDMETKLSVKLDEKNCMQLRYTLLFPQWFGHKGRAVEGLISVFEYSLSDIVKGNKNARGKTIIKQIREYMSEEHTISVNK